MHALVLNLVVATSFLKGQLHVHSNRSDIDNAPPGSPSTEAIWDDVLTSGGVLWGTATDDAHHFYDAPARAARGEETFTADRGFVMVHANRDLASIRDAIARGDFYASTGLLLRRIASSPTELAIEVEGTRPCRFRFIGPGGKQLQASRGRSAKISLAGRNGYVRAVIEDDAGRRAYVQPVFLPVAP